MIRTSLAAAAVLSLALAAPSVAQAPKAAAAQSGTYKVEPSHTRVLFAVNHMGFTTWYGDFTKASGSLKLDAADPAKSQVEVSVPTATVSTTNTVLDGELKAADWLDAAKFPAMTFKSTKVTPTGAGRADIAGDLTLHGVTKPVVLHAKFNGSGPNPMTKAVTVGFDLSGQIKRSEFGVSKYVPMVGDNVDLIISAAFEKTAG
jgi:polyisoprenoid-binding protein YceI